ILLCNTIHEKPSTLAGAEVFQIALNIAACSPAIALPVKNLFANKT
ncbi:hypothetical protein A2U01_0071169, partial [Trifolium medium]|nr:hypothetical protein [Trifolium medium]